VKRCAIIGCGRNVEDLHIPALRGLKDVEIISACDIDKDRLKVFANKYGIKYLFNDFASFLKSGLEVDFIDISTPGFTHFDLCCSALDAGYNLLVEKPVTLSFKETLKLMEKAEKQKSKVCVIQNYRYRDVVLKAKSDFDRGRVGNIHQVNITYHGQSVFNEPTSWSWEERRNKTLLYEICLHYLDLQVYFAGQVKKIITVKSFWNKHLNSTEKIYALVEHLNGAIGVIDLQFNSSSNYVHFELFGSANDILIKFFPEYYRIYSGNVSPIDELYYDWRRIWDFAKPVLREKIFKPRVTRRAKSHYRLFKLFVDALSDDRCKVPVSLEDILPTMELADKLAKRVYN